MHHMGDSCMEIGRISIMGKRIYFDVSIHDAERGTTVSLTFEQEQLDEIIHACNNAGANTLRTIGGEMFMGYFWEIRATEKASINVFGNFGLKLERLRRQIETVESMLEFGI